MKKNIQYALIAMIFLGSTLQSCKKNILETIPNDRVSSEVFWKTEADARFAVNSVYSSLDAVNLFVLDGITDIGHTNTVFTVEYNIENGSYDASHSRVQTEWQSGYRGIFLANYVLENIDKVKTSNTALISQFKAEARALRAYHYIKLVGLYGDVPLVNTNVTPADGLKVSRSKASDVWAFIDKELT
ncbi:MAG: hypothetical protein RLZZ45_522, partial [Bacteroidota bacterium]